MEIWQALEFVLDNQIEPFVELNIGLDNIHRFGADYVRRGNDFPGPNPTPEERCKIFS